MDGGAVGECHGCLICGTVRRPLRCEDCVNQALGEKRRISNAACAGSEAARGRLASALEPSLQTTLSTTVRISMCTVRLSSRLIGVHGHVPRGRYRPCWMVRRWSCFKSEYSQRIRLYERTPEFDVGSCRRGRSDSRTSCRLQRRRRRQRRPAPPPCRRGCSKVRLCRHAM